MASDFRDDLFGDDFDDDNNFDDSGFDDSGFDFEEDDGFEAEFGGLGLDEDEDFGDFDEDFSDEFAATSGSSGGGGPSPVFIGIAVLMIILLLGALGLIAYLVIIAPASPSELTSTAVVATNDARRSLGELTATQSKLNLDATMTAESYTDTPTPSPTFTDTPTPTEDLSALETAAFQSTLEAANVLATETAIAATQTLGAQLNPPDVVTDTSDSTTPIVDVTEDPSLGGTSVAGDITATTMPTGQAVEIGAVQMTATALAQILVPPTESDPIGTPIAGGGTPGDATPTIEVVNPTPNLGGTGGGTGGNLPDTGLFDDVFGGNPLAIFLAAFGLLGVIVLSRHLRGENRKRK